MFHKSHRSPFDLALCIGRLEAIAKSPGIQPLEVDLPQTDAIVAFCRAGSATNHTIPAPRLSGFSTRRRLVVGEAVAFVLRFFLRLRPCVSLLFGLRFCQSIAFLDSPD